MRGLQGKVAIVTGGASGIGAAACRRFVAEGAQVAIGDMNGEGAERLAEELGDAAHAFQFDAENVDEVEQLVAKAVDHFGKLDCLYANHAMMGPEWIARDTNPIDMEFEVFDRMYAVNARGFMALARYSLPHMFAAGGGSIVFTSAASSMAGDFANFGYASSKAAINNMARFIATMYGKQGVRCNAISPGLIATEGAKANVSEKMFDQMLQHMLTPRVGRPEDVAAMAVYLCSDDAAFITGQVICVDGGTLAHVPHYADALAGRFDWDG